VFQRPGTAARTGRFPLVGHAADRLVGDDGEFLAEMGNWS